jgi:hypothetical protein
MKIKIPGSFASIVVMAALATGCSTSQCSSPGAKPVSIFDGKSLVGWTQDPTNATTISGGDITDPAALAQKLSGNSDPVSSFISGKMDADAKAAISATNMTPKSLRSALSKALNAVITNGLIYDESRFSGIQLRPETSDLLKQQPQGAGLLRLNRVLLEDAYPSILSPSPATAWIVKDGAMASTGAGRGTIYTDNDYGHFRVTFTMRHVSGKPDHQACVLIFCTRPAPGEKGMDALGGIQFQVPNGGHWDYRKGHNNGGKGEFTDVKHAKLDVTQWSRVEIVADAATGVARMAVAQPPGSKAVEVLDFKEPTAGRAGPFALQMHNGGLFDEYKDIQIEANPASDDLITTK